jgi:hypothetical protein
VIQYERQFVAMHGSSDVDENRALVNASDARRGHRRGRGNGNPSRGKRYCTYCGKDNHIVDNCYKKHGFPPSYGRTLQTNQASADEINDLDETRSYRGNESYGFTKDQYEKLVNLLQSNASTSASTSTSANAAQVNVIQHHQTGIAYSLSNSTYGSWIIDSGASDHICSSLSFYDTYHAITPIQVKMANGSISYAKFSGTVKLFDQLVVHNCATCARFLS